MYIYSHSYRYVYFGNAGIIKSGAKLLGLTPANKKVDNGKSSNAIIKVIPFTVHSQELSQQTDDYIVVVTPSSLSLWSHWNSIGKERYHWDYSLSIILEEDVSYMLGQFVGRVFVQDVCMMPITSDEDSANVTVGLLILSACRIPPSYEPNGHDTYNIFLHYLEFDLSSTPLGTTQRAVLAVGIDDFREFPHEIQPRLHADSSNGNIMGQGTSLVTPTWVQQGTLRACQVDISCLDFVSEDAKKGSSDSLEELTTVGISIVDIISNQDASAPQVDSSISADHILAMSPLAGVQGLSLLTRDGLLTVVNPPIPGTFLNKRAVQLSTKKMLSYSQRFPPSSPDVLDNLILTITKGDDEFHDVDIGQQVLAATLSQMSRLPGSTPDSVIEKLSVVVQAISDKLINRASGAYNLNTQGIDELNDVVSRPGESLVHRLLEYKTELHTRLIRTLFTIPEWLLEKTQNMLLLDHELLLAASSLCRTIQEMQIQIQTNPVVDETDVGVDDDNDDKRFITSTSSSSSSSSSSKFLDVSRHKAMTYIRNGIEAAVNNLDDKFDEPLSQIGLSVEDIFFGNVSSIPDGLVSIASILEREVLASSNQATDGNIDHFPTIYGVLTVLLSYLEASEVAPKSGSTGQDGLRTSLQCDPRIRKATKIILDLAFQFSTDYAVSNTQSKKKIDFRKDREGARIKDMCLIYIRGYGIEAAALDPNTSSTVSAISALYKGIPIENPAAYLEHCSRQQDSTGGEIMGSGVYLHDDWKTEYLEALETTMNLLLQLGFTNTVFVASAQHLHAPGLLMAVDKDREGLIRHLHRFVHIRAVDETVLGVPLAIRCLEWLEQTPSENTSTQIFGNRDENMHDFREGGACGYRTDEILDLGKNVPPLVFQDFFSTRPHLAMIYSIRTQEFNSAAIYGIEFTRNSTTARPLSSTKSLYSLSKLCAYAENDHSTNYNDADSTDVRDIADRGLLEVLAQEQLLSLHDGKISEENHFKMSTDRLVQELLSYLDKSTRSICSMPPSSTKSDVVGSNIHQINTLIAVITEQMKSNVDISPREDVNVKISHNLLELWSYVVAGDFAFIYDLYQDQNLPSEMIQSKLYGDESNGSLLIKILSANMEDAKKTVIDPRTLLGYPEFQGNIIESGAIDDFLTSAPNDTHSEKIIQYLVEAAFKIINDVSTASGDEEMKTTRDRCFSVPPQFYIKKIDQCINLVLAAS